MTNKAYNENATNEIASMKRALNGKHHPLNGDVAIRNLFVLEDRMNLIDANK